jgi:hypothetical protein
LSVECPNELCDEKRRLRSTNVDRLWECHSDIRQRRDEQASLFDGKMVASVLLDTQQDHMTDVGQSIGASAHHCEEPLERTPIQISLVV